MKSKVTRETPIGTKVVVHDKTVGASKRNNHTYLRCKQQGYGVISEHGIREGVVWVDSDMFTPSSLFRYEDLSIYDGNGVIEGSTSKNELNPDDNANFSNSDLTFTGLTPDIGITITSGAIRSSDYYPILRSNENYKKLFAIQTIPDLKVFVKDKEITLDQLIEIIEKNG